MNELDNIDEKELYKFIYSSHLIRIMILLKITNALNMKAIKKKLKKYIELNQTGNIQHLAPIYKILPDLLNQLDQ